MVVGEESMVGTGTAGDSPEIALQAAELERARLENEKLRLELADLKNKRGRWLSELGGRVVAIVTTLLAIGGFVWGILQFQLEQRENRASQQRQAEREFMKPWLESQWDSYMKALAAATTLATSEDSEKVKQASDEFWVFYYGKMILVETRDVSKAMVRFGHCLDGTDTCDKSERKGRALQLASAMAKSLAETAGMTYEQFAANQFQYVASQSPTQ